MTLLSVLDQTPVISGHSVADAIAATVELAQLADDLGYTRYWCAEHHGLRGVSNPCPEVMLARLAASRDASGWAPAASCCRTTARSRSPSNS